MDEWRTFLEAKCNLLEACNELQKLKKMPGMSKHEELNTHWSELWDIYFLMHETEAKIWGKTNG